jgi:hypothetical protein
METNKKTDEIEVIEIEVFAKAGKPVPKGKHYRIRVDKETFVVRHETITGKEILTLVPSQREFDGYSR